MSDFKKIQLNELNLNPFTAINEGWMLITAKTNNKVNTMTASWGGMGTLWNKPVCFAFIRGTRYTKEFIDNTNNFTLSFFKKGEFRKELGYLGKVSGRDEDKIALSGLTKIELDNEPCFLEAETVFVLKKLSCHFIDESGILDKEMFNICYPNGNLHYMYIGEVISAYNK